MRKCGCVASDVAFVPNPCRDALHNVCVISTITTHMTGRIDLTVEIDTISIVTANLENCGCPVLSISLVKLPDGEFRVVCRDDMHNVKMSETMLHQSYLTQGNVETFTPNIQRLKSDKLATVVLRSIVAPTEHFPSYTPRPQEVVVEADVVQQYSLVPLMIMGSHAHLPNKVHRKASCPPF